jgi:lipoyl(octanoyl) transferase
MMRQSVRCEEANDLSLRAYVLGIVDFETTLRLQRRLHFEVCENRTQAALMLCEHPPAISVGRLGSHAHIRLTSEDIVPRRLPVRWVNRGGGCVLHLPGQLAVYPILPLDSLRLNVADYLRQLGETFLDLTTDFSLRAPATADDTGLRVGGRLVGAFGIAVRDWVTSFGAYLNIQPPLDLYRFVQATPARGEPMSSLECERRGPVRPAMVRQRLLEHFQARFGFTRMSLFTDHPALAGKVQRPNHARPSAVHRPVTPNPRSLR